MTPFLDAYAVLGVRPDASQGELKAAHRHLVRAHHPDLRPPAERQAATRRVQDVNVAYGLVRDPGRRAAYDRFRAGVLRRERLSEADTAAAAQWDRLVTDAGRWAGGWWGRHRGAARRAASRAQAAGVGVVGRLRWVVLAAVWTLGGLTAAVFAQDFRGVEGPATLLVGGLGGLWVGHRAGRRALLRASGAAPPSAPVATAGLLALGALALLGSLWIDARW